MVLIGLENCKGCHILHDKYPDFPYIEVPRKIENADKDTYEIKKALARLGVREFPVLLNDSMTQVLPLSLIDKDLK